MKSTMEELKKRGYTTKHETELIKKSGNVYDYLKSEISSERTAAVRIISDECDLNFDTVSLLCKMLVSEKALYTKIEICSLLSEAPEEFYSVITEYLGFSGNNQYNEIPEKLFGKKSYPLPRDIFARTLAHAGYQAIPVIFEVFEEGSISKVREAVDAIGFICFYDEKCEVYFEKFYEYSEKFSYDKICRWKFVRAFRSFNNTKVKNILGKISVNDEDNLIRREASESLKIINNKK